MEHHVRTHGQPSPPQSSEGDHLVEYQGTHVREHPYTPPQSHVTQQFNYGDPAEFEMVQQHPYLNQPTLYHTPTFHTPPAPLGSSVQTRSGRSLSSSPMTNTSSLSSRYSSSPRPKKAKGRKKTKVDALPLSEPLSIVTKDYDVPVMDMMVWANRSNEERYREVDSKHRGKIPRPMNSFMLYRTAYKERIKKWGQQGDNNQLISKVAGLSWPLEPIALREFYAKCANVERDNHGKAFPNYKFAPNKQPRKRGRDDDNDESDPEWDGSSNYNGRRSRKKEDRPIPRSTSSTPAPALLSPRNEFYHPSSFQASNPHGVPPIVGMDQWGRPVQYTQFYHPGAGYQYQMPMYEMQNASVSHQTFPQQTGYASQLVGLPPTAVEDLFGSHLAEHPELLIDPGLDSFNLEGNYQYGSFPIEQQLQSVPRNRDNMHQVEAGAAIHPGMQMLTHSESPWPRAQSGSAFDDEFTRWNEKQ